MTKVYAAVIALLMSVAAAAPASAQGLGDKETPLDKQEKLRIEERKAIERDYETTMKRLKKQGATEANSNDPWAVVRPAAEVKTEKTEPKKTEPKKR